MFYLGPMLVYLFVLCSSIWSHVEGLSKVASRGSFKGPFWEAPISLAASFSVPSRPDGMN